MVSICFTGLWKCWVEFISAWCVSSTQGTVTSPSIIRLQTLPVLSPRSPHSSSLVQSFIKPAPSLQKGHPWGWWPASVPPTAAGVHSELLDPVNYPRVPPNGKSTQLSFRTFLLLEFCVHSSFSLKCLILLVFHAVSQRYFDVFTRSFVLVLGNTSANSCIVATLPKSKPTSVEMSVVCHAVLQRLDLAYLDDAVTWICLSSA